MFLGSFLVLYGLFIHFLNWSLCATSIPSRFSEDKLEDVGLLPVIIRIDRGRNGRLQRIGLGRRRPGDAPRACKFAICGAVRKRTSFEVMTTISDQHITRHAFFWPQDSLVSIVGSKKKSIRATKRSLLLKAWSLAATSSQPTRHRSCTSSECSLFAIAVVLQQACVRGNHVPFPQQTGQNQGLLLTIRHHRFSRSVSASDFNDKACSDEPGGLPA
ncbi:hypothetical protein IWX47DRAFT_160027 [Phyllosticta citricarpa]